VQRHVIIHRHADRLPDTAKGTVVALGNFDGVHLGHQAVIGEAVRRAKSEGRPSSVLTFEPHPRRFFQPAAPPFLLAQFRAKARVIAGLGVDHLIALHFDTELASRTAEEFVESILIAGLAARHVVVGYDFVFGKGRTGTPDLMRGRLAARGVGVTSVPAFTIPSSALSNTGRPEPAVSSTGVRDALRAGDVTRAARLLGRPFEIEGRVMHGDKRGRTLGFPTANLALGDYLRPALGIYAIRAGVTQPGLTDAVTWYGGVASLGINPTIAGEREARLEANLFDFDGDLYGRRLRVALVGYLRGEQKFDGLETLKAQIARDAAEARRILAQNRP
jgi:riboflavin kinase/FMN adenylyltransferase